MSACLVAAGTRACLGVDPLDLSAFTSAAIVDIRPEQERYGEMGYIPGSVSVSEDELEAQPAQLLDWCPIGRPVVLACLSGRRCEPWLERIAALGYGEVDYLRGGLLSWRAGGLPVAGVATPAADDVPEVASLDEFPLVVRSCFVAQSVVTQLAAGAEEVCDPSELVEQLFFGEAGGTDKPRYYAHALDRLADQARVMHHDLDAVAANLDVMRAALQPFLA